MSRFAYDIKIDRELLAKTRQGLNLSQTEAGKIFGVSCATYKRWESADVAFPLDLVHRMESEFGFEPGELLSRRDEE